MVNRDENKYFDQLLDWLEMESLAQRQRMDQRRAISASQAAESGGETLLDLAVSDHDTGIGGHFLLTFVKRNRKLSLPWNRFKVGSPVIVSAQEDLSAESLSGVVSRLSGEEIQVALDQWPAGDIYRIDMSPDEVTRQRQQQAIATVRSSKGRLRKLRDVLLGYDPPKFSQMPDISIDSALNESQQDAIRFALSAKDAAVIHGPPGTGKTTTITEMICYAVARGESVFACAPSNTAVDNLVLRLARKGIRLLRLGHPARVHEDLQQHTLDARVANEPAMQVVRQMMRESEALFRKANRYTRTRPARGEKQMLRRDAMRLRDDARQLERQAVKSLVANAEVICATTSFDGQVLGDRGFDLVVVDEACQSTQPGCWPVIVRAGRVVFAGDHCQLPPTILSTEAAQQGFDISMMQKLVQQYGEQITRRLDVQYRMHHQIMEFPSQQFYAGTLVADGSVFEHRLSDLPDSDIPPHLDAPIMYYDSAGAGWDEELEPEGFSRRNVQEARWVLDQAKQLCDAGVDPDDIGIIAPYAAQARWLRKNCHSRRIEVDTVDGFQGREKEVILISLVRSNTIGEIGFLADTRRMNVALTRARRKLLVVGDSATMGCNEFYQEFFQYIEKIGAYHSVWEDM